MSYTMKKDLYKETRIAVDVPECIFTQRREGRFSQTQTRSGFRRKRLEATNKIWGVTLTNGMICYARTKLTCLATWFFSITYLATIPPVLQ